MSTTYSVRNVPPDGRALRPLTSQHARPPQPPGPPAGCRPRLRPPPGLRSLQLPKPRAGPHAAPTGALSSSVGTASPRVPSTPRWAGRVLGLASERDQPGDPGEHESKNKYDPPMPSRGRARVGQLLRESPAGRPRLEPRSRLLRAAPPMQGPRARRDPKVPRFTLLSTPPPAAGPASDAEGPALCRGHSRQRPAVPSGFRPPAPRTLSPPRSTLDHPGAACPR